MATKTRPEAPQLIKSPRQTEILMENSTTLKVKKVKEFLLGRHIALLGSLLAIISTFLEWGIEPITGTNIKGLEGSDPQVLFVMAFVIFVFLLIKRFYKFALITGIASLVISIVQYVEFSKPMELASGKVISPEVGIGIYLALIGTAAICTGSTLQIFKNH